MLSEPIGVTAGDPAGVGPEITLKALRACAERDGEAPGWIVFGSVSVMRQTAARDNIEARINESTEPAVWPSVSVVSVGEPSAPVPVGAVSAEAGRIAYESIARAVDEAMQRRLAAVVTAPISKEALNLAGYPYTGHTEMLGHLSGSRDTCMMLAHETLRVAHVSTHTALARVPDLVTPERLDRVLTLTIDALRQLGIAEPRIAVAALNPHAGEGGLFGREDIDITQPVVERYRANGLAVSGPIAGDTVFVRAVAGEFDAVIAMYHDQGHVPVKLLGFRVDPVSGRWLGLRGVNITLGLPFIRTSVDHGTAFDIAAQGIASAQSMVEAIDMAVKLSRQTHAAGPETQKT